MDRTPTPCQPRFSNESPLDGHLGAKGRFRAIPDAFPRIVSAMERFWKGFRSSSAAALTVLGSLYFLLETLGALLKGGGFPLPLWYGAAGLAVVVLFSFGVARFAGILGRWTGTRCVAGTSLMLAAGMLTFKTWLVFGNRAVPAGVAAGGAVLVLLGLELTRRPARISVPLSAATLIFACAVSTDLLRVAGRNLHTFDDALVLSFLVAAFAGSGVWYVWPRGEGFAEGFLRGRPGHLILAGLTLIVGTIWWATRQPIAWQRGSPYRGPPLQLETAEKDGVNDPPNIILISVDTLRRDAVPPLADHSLPSLERLRRDSVQFDALHTESSVTLPTHASLFTGLVPFEHGAMSRLDAQIDQDLPLYPQVLRRLGYHTAGVTGGGWVRKEFGFARGYDSFWSQPHVVSPYGGPVPGGVELVALLLSRTPYRFHFRLSAKRAKDVGRVYRRRYFRAGVDRALDRIRRFQEDSRPFYLFLHTYQVHDYKDRYPSAMRWLRDQHGELFRALRDPEDPSLSPVAASKREVFGHRLREIRPREWANTRSISGRYRQYQAWRRLYDYGVGRVDRQLARLMRFLREQELYRETAIVFLSDHGEGFLLTSGAREHGWGQLDEVLLRVPLWIKLPENVDWERPGRVTLQLRDVFPLLLDLLGLPDPVRKRHEEREGFLPVLDDQGSGRDHTVAMVRDRHDTVPRLSVRGSNFKLVVSLRPREEAFYRVRDRPPLQKSVRADSVPTAVREELRFRARTLLDQFRAGPNPLVPRTQPHRPALLRELRGMGYLR